MSSPLQADCDAAIEETSPDVFDALRGARVLLTGGTGFVGSWLLELLLRANETLGLGVRVVVLTRNPAAFREKSPRLAGASAIECYPGDVTKPFRPGGPFDYVIHAATEANPDLNEREPQLMFDTIVGGTRETLEVAAISRCRRLLLVSSGAVYGRQPAGVEAISEAYLGAPDPTSPQAAYGEGKRAAELLCVLGAKRGGFEATIARCFAFVGPYLPLNRRFAAGNFIRDAMAGGPVLVRGDGTAVRSYLYASDLAVWLLTILTLGISGRPYNVGSADPITISSLAQTVADVVNPRVSVTITGARPAPVADPIDRYVPNTDRARTELNLRSTVTLAGAIKRTERWYTER
jgi:nucleoside-diphosphate-sugar epimerase